MKTLATPLFFLNKPISFGQEVLNKLSPTTEAEYNYLTKGYRVQMESGLDMTKGYTFQDMDHVKYGNYSCQVKVSFVRKNKELAGLLVCYKIRCIWPDRLCRHPINNGLFTRYFI